MTLLARSDNVSPEQVARLQELLEAETKHSAQHVIPALKTYDDFLTKLVEAQKSELEAARKRGTIEQENSRLLEAKRKLDDMEQDKRVLNTQKSELAKLKGDIQDTNAEIDSLTKKEIGFEEGISKLERDLKKDISDMVEGDKVVALQKAELEAIEKEYLQAEQSIFDLQRDIKMVSENNSDLLRLCDSLMKKIEETKK
jgi:chromosome segregation ATPase